MGWQANSSKLPCFYYSLLQMKIKTDVAQKPVQLLGQVHECRMGLCEIPIVSPALSFHPPPLLLHVLSLSPGAFIPVSLV